MNNVLIKYIAFPSASSEVYKRGEEIIKKTFPEYNFIESEKNPELIFILSGGSENQAKEIVHNLSSVLLIAMNENNSYAAATEIKAYCNQNNIKSLLINIDIEKKISKKVGFYFRFYKAINNLKKYRIGLIGNVSKWLIASNMQSEVLKSKFGIELIQYDWKNLKNYTDFKANTNFINHFKNSIGFDLSDSSKVYDLLANIIEENKLDAITVECFPMVWEHSVTACLALSKLNNDNIPAGCEGDLTSISGMIIGKELTGQIPWMANLITLNLNKNSVFLAHCTIGTNMVSDYNITTHFETNTGNAVQGKFLGDEVTIFRFDKNLEKAFISYGKVIDRPDKNDACRTQIEVELTENAIESLKHNPLGNHHLVLAGKHTDILSFFCKMTMIEII